MKIDSLTYKSDAIRNATASFATLPHEIILRIFSQFSVSELCQISSVSRQWEKFAHDSSLYSSFCKKYFPETCKKSWVQACIASKGWENIFKLLSGIQFPFHVFEKVPIDGWASIAFEASTLVLANRKGIYIIDLLKEKKISQLVDLKIEFEIFELVKPIRIALDQGRLVVNTVLFGGGRYRNIFEIFNVDSNKSFYTFEGNTRTVSCLGFKDDYVIYGNEDHTITVWNIVNGLCVHTLKGHLKYVHSVKIDRDKIVSSDSDGLIKIWDIDTGKCLITLEGHKGPVMSIDIEGNHIVSGGDDKKVRVWDIETGKCLNIFEGHESEIRQVILQNDLILSVSRIAKEGEKNVLLWDLKTGKCIREYNAIVAGAAMQGEVILLATNEKTYSVFSLKNYKKCDLHYSFLSKCCIQ